jgi:hypothetical protein
MPKTKYLVETSATPLAVAFSTRAQCSHFAEETRDGGLWTSVYIRMEFIRRFFCDLVLMALTIKQCTSVADAFYSLQHDFSQRRVKSMLAGVALMLQESGKISNADTAAEEVASRAVNLLKTFDKVFVSRVPNLCKCKIGGKPLELDYNNMLDELHAFREAFLTPVTDCEVNGFLEFSKPQGRTRKLLADANVRGLPVGQTLAELCDRNAHVECKACATIGDAVIAMEQPRSWCLLHLDKSFNDLCRQTSRKHKIIKSAPALKKQAETEA